MVICPSCQSENRAGAKFCKNCAALLPDTPASTRPLTRDSLTTIKLSASKQTIRLDQEPKLSANKSGSGTRPLPAEKGYIQRPSGAIFGDTFLLENILFSDEHQHRYKVRQLLAPADQLIRACSNPECGAVYPPREDAPEKFCTNCGQLLEIDQEEMFLVETRTPIADDIVLIVAKGLSHGNVRAPIKVFLETVAGTRRYCKIIPIFNAIEKRPEPIQALKWGVDLANGLEYLHDNGVMFNGQINSNSFGLANEHAVWSNFAQCVHHADGYVDDRLLDVKALAAHIYWWITGRTGYEYDSSITAEMNKTFEFVLGPKGITTGWELAKAFEIALREAASPQAVDYRLGRRAHVGMVRNLNEDSLLTLEINSTLKSVSRSMGVFVVADGMGGHAAGELASGTIINVIAQKSMQGFFPNRTTGGEGQDCASWLRQAVAAANQEVFALRKSAGSDMGSTLVAAALEGNVAYITHVGDSRAYLINRKVIQQITVDHSLVERLIATNQITREEARYHPQRNVIYRTVGDKPNIDLDVIKLNLSDGDYLLLCSDGLSGMLEDQTIFDIVTRTPSPQAACDELINVANTAGGEDNLSVVIIQVVKV